MHNNFNLKRGVNKSRLPFPQAIGGEFELGNMPQQLVAPANLTQGFPGSWTVSGRAALCALLESLKKQGIYKVLVPAYLCESVLQPIKACGLIYKYYPVDENLAARPEPPKGSAVILIHYFGWLNPSTNYLREASGDSFTLIEDMTQAVFSSWELSEDLRSLLFFSLRKFGPVPLGGWFNQVKQLPLSDPAFKALFWKSLAVRLYKYSYMNTEIEVNDQTEQTYLDLFHSVEGFFDLSCKAYRLDDEARYLINNIDWENAASVRRNNWCNLRSYLGDLLTPFNETLGTGVVPLGYVVRCTEREKIQQRLHEARIFCPVHWRLPKDLDAKRFPISYKLSNSLMTIPIDQRYGIEDTQYIVQAIRQTGLC